MFRWIALMAPAAVFVLAACTGGGATPAPTAAPASVAPASAAAMEVMGKGEFQPVDGKAGGVAEIVVLPDGGYEIILESFSIDAIAHTNVVLVENATVTATADIDETRLLDLGPLQATEGMQVYKIPPDMAATVMDGYHSVVIWDTEMAHAIAAAPLS